MPAPPLPIDDMPGFLIRRLQQKSTAAFAAATAGLGLDVTSVQYAAMVAIGAAPGLDQATLAARIAHDRVTIGGVVDRLVQKGFVDRQVSRTDRRARRLALTPAGRQALERLTPAVEQAQVAMLTPLDAAGRDALLDLLRRIVAAP